MNCKQCGVEFTPHSYQQVHCSSHCRNLYSRKRYRNRVHKKFKPKRCEVCKRPAISKHKTRKVRVRFCSVKCRISAWKAQFQKAMGISIDAYRRKKKEESRKPEYVYVNCWFCQTPTCTTPGHAKRLRFCSSYCGQAYREALKQFIKKGQHEKVPSC